MPCHLNCYFLNYIGGDNGGSTNINKNNISSTSSQSVVTFSGTCGHMLKLNCVTINSTILVHLLHALRNL